MGEKTIRILFTSVGRRVELMQAFRSAARRIGCKLELFGADITDTAPALQFCDRSVIVPRIKDPDYIPFLLRVCAEERIHALVPTIDTDLLLLAENRDAFDTIGTWVLVGEPEKVRLCRDKRKTAGYFHSVGLASPSPVDDIAAYQGGFPAFIKPRDGSSSIDAYRVETAKELADRAEQVQDYIVQPFVEGTEYTVDVFCDLRGEPVYITPRIRLAVRAGEVLKTQIQQDGQIIEEMKRLTADFRPRGAITVQLIRDQNTGTDQYIEINPRFGGGAPLSMKAGADSAEALLRLLSGEKIGYQPLAASDGAVYSRFDQSVCVTRGRGEPKLRKEHIRAVIFDLDDTLYSERDYVRSGFWAVARQLPEISRADEKLWAYFQAGKPAIDALLDRENIRDAAVKAACIGAYREHLPQISLYPGAAELLRQLREQGVLLGILTDGRPEGQRAKLKALGLSNLVDEIIVTDELGGPRFRKPNDIPFRMMQCRLNVPFEQMVYIGDNPRKDFSAPTALGMQTVFFRNPEGLYYTEEKSDHPEVTSFSDLMKLFL